MASASSIRRPGTAPERPRSGWAAQSPRFPRSSARLSESAQRLAGSTPRRTAARRPVRLAATFMRCGLASAQTTTRRPARAAPSPPRSPALACPACTPCGSTTQTTTPTTDAATRTLRTRWRRRWARAAWRRGSPCRGPRVLTAEGWQPGEGGMVDALRAMRDEGAISQVGLGMNCNRMPHQGVPEEIARLVTGAPQGTFDSALLAGGWNLLSQDGLATLQLCARRGVAVHVAGVFASGLLVGGDTFAYKAAPPEVVDRARRWGELAAAHGHDLPAVAVAFAALPAVVTRVVVGMASPGQVEQTLAWVEQSRQVGGEVWRAAKQAGLLDASLPTPPPPPNPAGGSPRAAAPLLPAPASLPTCPPAAPLGVDGVVARLEELRGWCSAGTWRAALALVAGEAPVEESPLGQAAGMEERCERAEAALREARVAQHVAAHDAVGAASHCRRSVKELVSLHRALDASLAAMEGNAADGR
mmetsp:Transcript_45949/g.144500  ORF Transcript_45949/g.144500 Transcript_45949/m.144500 type:complete len:474 (-) Transcript_45949:328-1749(-)